MRIVFHDMNCSYHIGAGRRDVGCLSHILHKHTFLFYFWSTYKHDDLISSRVAMIVKKYENVSLKKTKAGFLHFLHKGGQANSQGLT